MSDVPLSPEALDLIAAAEHDDLPPPGSRARTWSELTRRYTIDPTAVRPSPLVAGQRVGPYRVRSRLGAGGMGVVYRAWDGRLDRDIALKVLAPRSGGSSHSPHLLEEARLAAQVVHPNVVQVFDIGEVDDRVFVAMELAEGRDLRAWLHERRRDRADILALFVQAGEGLVAVHEAGLVHRDFKPGNVLIGRDGRPQVADFGLARLCAPQQTQPSVETQPRFVEGTPWFIAPELYEGEEGDARVDQYAFCVSLREALEGRNPFAGLDTGELRRTKSVPLAATPPDLQRVPAGVWAVLRRGMAPDPADRYPNMRALVDDLRRPPSRWRAWWGVAGAGAGTLAMTWMLVSPPGPARPDPCTATHAQLDAAWNDDTRGRMATAWAGDAPSLSRLDAHVNALEAQLVHACEGATAARWGCVRGHVDGFDEALAVLRETTPQARVRVLAELGDPSRCSNNYELALLAIPDSTRPRAYRARAQVRRAEALWEAGASDDAIAEVEAATGVFRDLGAKLPLAQALATLGIMQRQRDVGEPAETLARAYYLALELGLETVATPTALELTLLELERGNLDDAQHWLDVAEAALVRYGKPAPATWTRWHRHRALLHDARGHHDEALAQLRQAYDTAHGAQLEDLALTVQAAMAKVEYERGNHPAAVRLFRSAYEARRASSGADHRVTRMLQVALAAALNDAGRYDASQALLQPAIEALKRLDPPPADQLSAALDLHADALEALGHHEDALATWTRALALTDDAALHRAVLGDRAEALRLAGELDEAERDARDALANAERRFGLDAVQTLSARLVLARIDLDRGDTSAAQSRLSQLSQLSQLDAVALSPRARARVANVWAHLERVRGDEARALEHIDAQLELHRSQPAVPVVARTHALLDRVELLLALGRLAQARETIDDAVEALGDCPQRRAHTRLDALHERLQATH